MEEREIFEVLKSNILDVVPEIDAEAIVPDASMRDLGANSVDRADIVIETMAALGVKFPMHELGLVKTIGGLTTFFHDKLKQGQS